MAHGLSPLGKNPHLTMHDTEAQYYHMTERNQHLQDVVSQPIRLSVFHPLLHSHARTSSFGARARNLGNRPIFKIALAASRTGLTRDICQTRWPQAEPR